MKTLLLIGDSNMVAVMYKLSMPIEMIEDQDRRVATRKFKFTNRLLGKRVNM